MATYALPPALASIIPNETLRRVWEEPLIAAQLYRKDADVESWNAHEGETSSYFRPAGLKKSIKNATLTISASRNLSGSPAPTLSQEKVQTNTYDMEMFSVTMDKKAHGIDTHLPADHVSAVPLITQDTKNLAEQAGGILNRIARDKMFKAYLGGYTFATAQANAAATEIHVASVAGFRTAWGAGKHREVSVTYPLTIYAFQTTTTGVFQTLTVTSVTSKDPVLNPDGPGILNIAAPGVAGGTTIVKYASILSANRPLRLTCGLTNSWSNITHFTADAAQSLKLVYIQQVIATMRHAGVPKHADGYYHCHLDSFGALQLIQDLQNSSAGSILQATPEHILYRNQTLGVIADTIFIMNEEAPSLDSIDPDDMYATNYTFPTGGNNMTQAFGHVDFKVAQYSAPYIPVTVNNVTSAAYKLGYCMITGGGSLIEKYVDETGYLSYFANAKKVGGFMVSDRGEAGIVTDRIRYIMQWPTDRLMEVLPQSWSWSGDFGVPCDEKRGNPSRFKRAVVLVYSLGAYTGL